jgi:hypothetical protein
MLRKDLFFLGASAGFRTVCEDVSFDFGIESALTVGDSVVAVVGLMELGVCKVSKHCLISEGAQKARTHTHKVGVSTWLLWEMHRDRRELTTGVWR